MFVPPLPLAPRGFNLDGHLFSQPARFPSPFIPPFQGIYAIVTFGSGLFGQIYRPLYIGQSDNLSRRVTKEHEKFEDWKRSAAGLPLYYSLYVTHGSEKERCDLEGKLIDQYQPPCNEKRGAFWETMRRHYENKT
jgi:hypothetical protein